MTSPKFDSLTLSDGCKLAYVLEGDPKGMPILFLNGVLMNMSSWVGQVAHFETNHLCVLHDFRGQLHSDKVFPKGFRMLQHALDLNELLDHLQLDECHVVGTSYGGEAALLFALHFPERVRTLSLVASVSYSDAVLKRQAQLWHDMAAISPKLLYDLIATMSYSPGFMEKFGPFLEKRQDSFSQLPNDFFKAFQQFCQAFIAFHVSDAELASLKIPTLIVTAENDILKPPRYGYHLAEHIPNATLLEIKDAGHALVLEKVSQLNKELDLFFSTH